MCQVLIYIHYLIQSLQSPLKIHLLFLFHKEWVEGWGGELGASELQGWSPSNLLPSWSQEVAEPEFKLWAHAPSIPPPCLRHQRLPCCPRESPCGEGTCSGGEYLPVTHLWLLAVPLPLSIRWTPRMPLLHRSILTYKSTRTKPSSLPGSMASWQQVTNTWFQNQALPLRLHVTGGRSHSSRHSNHTLALLDHISSSIYRHGCLCLERPSILAWKSLDNGKDQWCWVQSECETWLCRLPGLWLWEARKTVSLVAQSYYLHLCLPMMLWECSKIRCD